MLLNTQQQPTTTIDNTDLRKRIWYKYSMDIDGYEYSLRIGHRNRTFSAEDLMGFNNTGNICIWPSEETLSYYICTNLDRFLDKRVLELGGGMSCLAGLFVAKYAHARRVLVTDGNKTSIENVQLALIHNEFGCPVDCSVLKWGDRTNVDGQFDVILCADCLFFDDARKDLVESLWYCLDMNGIVLVMAPARGQTLDNFIDESVKRGFICKKIHKYNEVVWKKRLDLLDNCGYDDNIHYPILIEMTKF